MKFCQNCGAQLSDAANFCDKCGSKVASFESEQKKPQPVKEGVVYKCPFCGEILPSNVDKCPTCGHEIRGREALNSIKELASKLDATDDDIKKIEIIKTFPIPSNKEDIMEFMLLASSNFDVKHYLSYKKQETIDSAWLAKIEQCYQKAKLMFSNKSDLLVIENIYNETKAKLQTTSKNKLILLFVGIGLIVVGGIASMVGASNSKMSGTEATFDAMAAVMFVGLAILAVGIILVVMGVKKKKNAKDVEQERIMKAEKDKRRTELKIEKERNKRR